ncbi:hypothetical protein FD16_GL001205 [Paucilactobacillus suebicus DSM 5007 = KCTC 3549]|uniref:Uncharacterized protein n=1 Tax=Paucilactobacillus suebicus DSM 5007 = KCTC 3549 TaxID=1423807 RepID=A0A0R1W564_9LACO|nr:hypothetical protein FD16_GL001205 [Paucilactobacillus suebicus DSM 5007 = KCTC 3549]
MFTQDVSNVIVVSHFSLIYTYSSIKYGDVKLTVSSQLKSKDGFVHVMMIRAKL